MSSPSESTPQSSPFM
ncbi:hypothetical protein CRUP_027717 [Coryphaenoides rupestris]|nr:hypothetical protein CRUP_027717 [Coryphaenoides rupestris]